MRKFFRHQRNQLGFTLFELMVAIAIMAILTALSVPMYQNYIQKAALVDVLRYISPYKTALELCVLEEEHAKNCNNEILNRDHHSRYVNAFQVKSGIMTVTGKRALNGLTIIMTPQIHAADNSLAWQARCVTKSKNLTLEKSCLAIFQGDVNE